MKMAFQSETSHKQRRKRISISISLDRTGFNWSFKKINWQDNLIRNNRFYLYKNIKSNKLFVFFHITELYYVIITGTEIAQ